MNNLIDQRYLEYLPGVERSIYIDDNVVNIEFLLATFQDGFIYRKAYKNKEIAFKIIKDFLINSKKKKKQYISSDEIELSKKGLIQEIINDEIFLPEDGNGYFFKGDKEYLRDLLLIL